MSKKHVSGKISASYSVLLWHPPHAHLMYLLWKCHFMLGHGIEGFTLSQIHQKFSHSLEEATALRNQTHLLWEAASPAVGNKLPDSEGQRDGEERSQHRWTEEHVNIFCLLGEQGRSSFHRGNCVYIVIVVCEENAMVCFDSSQMYLLSVNVPASLPHVPNTVLNAFFLNKLFYCALESTAGFLCPIWNGTHMCTHLHVLTPTLHAMKRQCAFTWISFWVFWSLLLEGL